MKKAIFITLLLLPLLLQSCQEEYDYVTWIDHEAMVCGVEDPVTNLPWISSDVLSSLQPYGFLHLYEDTVMKEDIVVVDERYWITVYACSGQRIASGEYDLRGVPCEVYEDIPFDELPEKFVVKVTHGSTFNIICTDKDALDRKQVVEKCKKWLKAKFLPCYGEWFYGVEKPRVIVEKYLDDHTGRLRDYKVYCFNGQPKYIGVDTGNATGEHFKDIYDVNWHMLKGYEMAYPNSGVAIEKPKVLNELLNYAHILSEDFLHARIDFYIVEDHIIFGEITFTNSAGFGRVKPKKFALAMGNSIKLPRKQ